MDRMKKEFLDLSDKFYARFTDRIEGLGDEEYLWQPVPDCWSLQRDSDGKLHVQWGLVFDEVPPFTTIAWRYTHISDLLSEERCATWIGLEPEAEDLFAMGAPADASAARDMFQKAFARWKRYLAAADESTFFDEIGPVAQGFADRTRATFILDILDEAIHHGAEVGVLRDLYRAQRGQDGDVSALLRGESIAPTAIENSRAKHPDLTLRAAATAYWEAIPHLLELGFGVEGRDGRTPLHHAAADGRLELMKLLIDAGADVTARDPVYKATPAEWADYFGHKEAVEFLGTVSRS
jgi:hypothetical protein